MRIYTVPPDVELKDPISGKVNETITGARYAINFWLNDPRMIGGGPGTPMDAEKLARLIKITPKIVAGAAGMKVSLEDAEWGEVAKIVKAQHRYMDSLGEMLCQPFRDAFLAAEHVEIKAGKAAAPDGG